MSNPSHLKKRPQQKGARPGFVAGLLICAALAVAGTVFFATRHPRPAPATPETASPQAAADAGQNATVDAGTKETTVANRAAAAPHPATMSAPAPQPPTPKSPLAELISTLNDRFQPLPARRKAAKALAELGTPEALAALKEALITSPDAVRAIIAEALGSSTSPESATLLRGLLTDKSEVVAKGAVRGLAQQGSSDAVVALSQVLYNSTAPLNVRAEAGYSLGTVRQPGVVQTLTHAAMTIQDDDIVTQVLNGLGGRPINETQGFFQDYLSSPTTPGEMKIAALEAMGQAEGDTSPFLMNYLKDTDPEIRSAAAWALSAADTEGKLGSQLAALLQGETDPDVRRRIYQALGNQESLDVTGLQTLIQQETDPAARVAGLDLLAGQLRDNPSPELTAYFDQHAVAELKAVAMNAGTTPERLAALAALKRAGTSAALEAVQFLAQQSTDRRVQESAQKTFARSQAPTPPPKR